MIFSTNNFHWFATHMVVIKWQIKIANSEHVFEARWALTEVLASKLSVNIKDGNYPDQSSVIVV